MVERAESRMSSARERSHPNICMVGRTIWASPTRAWPARHLRDRAPAAPLTSCQPSTFHNRRRLRWWEAVRRPQSHRGARIPTIAHGMTRVCRALVNDGLTRQELPLPRGAGQRTPRMRRRTSVEQLSHRHSRASSSWTRGPGPPLPRGAGQRTPRTRRRTSVEQLSHHARAPSSWTRGPGPPCFMASPRRRMGRTPGSGPGVTGRRPPRES